MFCPLGRITLALVSGLFAVAPVSAATSSARASATVVAPARVSEDARKHWHHSQTVGVLTLVIPGCGRDISDCTLKSSTTGSVASGGVSVFSVVGGASLKPLTRALVSAGGTLSISGALSGTGVQIVVLNASKGKAGGKVTAIVTYN